MNTRTLPWVIDILDDGLRVYRRYFVQYALAMLLGLLPPAVVSILLNVVLINYLGSGWVILTSFITVPLSVLFFVYIMAVLSRMTAQALRGERPSARGAMRIGIGRVLGMGCWTTIFGLMTSLVIGGVAGLCACMASVGLMGGASALFSGSGGFAFVSFSVLVSVMGYMIVIGAVAVGAVYAIQAFALEQRPFGASISRGNDLLFFRFGRNIMLFFGAGALFATLLLAYAGALVGVIGLVVSSVQNFNVLNNFLSSPATTSWLSIVGYLTQIVLLPPVPIWMTIVFLRLRAERDGGDLEGRINTWSAQFQPASASNM